MEEDLLNPPAGPNKRQIVLYLAIGITGIVFFGLVFWFGAARMSDMQEMSSTERPILETSTQSVAESAPPGSGDTQPTPPVSREFTFEIVASDALRAKGLGGRADIPQDYGMLFVFPKKQSYSFWMKDMESSIDIIWLADTTPSGEEAQASSATIIGIEESVSPSTYPATFTAPEPVRYVLETRAGEAARLGWSVGTAITLPSRIPVPQ